MQLLTTADGKAIQQEDERRVECTRAAAAWKQVKHMAIFPNVSQVLFELRELRLGEQRPILKKKVGFEKWLFWRG